MVLVRVSSLSCRDCHWAPRSPTLQLARCGALLVPTGTSRAKCWTRAKIDSSFQQERLPTGLHIEKRLLAPVVFAVYSELQECGKDVPARRGSGVSVGLSKAARTLQCGVWGKAGPFAQEALESSGRKRLTALPLPGI